MCTFYHLFILLTYYCMINNCDRVEQARLTYTSTPRSVLRAKDPYFVNKTDDVETLYNGSLGFNSNSTSLEGSVPPSVPPSAQFSNLSQSSNDSLEASLEVTNNSVNDSRDSSEESDEVSVRSESDEDLGVTNHSPLVQTGKEYRTENPRSQDYDNPEARKPHEIPDNVPFANESTPGNFTATGHHDANLNQTTGLHNASSSTDNKQSHNTDPHKPDEKDSKSTKKADKPDKTDSDRETLKNHPDETVLSIIHRNPEPRKYPKIPSNDPISNESTPSNSIPSGHHDANLNQTTSNTGPNSSHSTDGMLSHGTGASRSETDPRKPETGDSQSTGKVEYVSYNTSATTNPVEPNNSSSSTDNKQSHSTDPREPEEKDSKSTEKADKTDSDRETLKNHPDETVLSKSEDELGDGTDPQNEINSDVPEIEPELESDKFGSAPTYNNEEPTVKFSSKANIDEPHPKIPSQPTKESQTIVDASHNEATDLNSLLHPKIPSQPPKESQTIVDAPRNGAADLNSQLHPDFFSEPSISQESKFEVARDSNITKEILKQANDEFSALASLKMLADMLPEPLRDYLEHASFPARTFVLLMISVFSYLIMFSISTFYSFKTDQHYTREELCRKDKQVLDVQTERDYLSDELYSAKKRIKQLELNNTNTQKTLEITQVKLSKTVEENRSLRLDNNNFLSKIDELSQCLKESEDRTATLEGENEDLKNAVSIFDKEGQNLAKLEEETRRLAQKLDESNSMYAELENKFKALEDEKVILTRESKSLKEQLDEKNSMLCAKDDELIYLQEKLDINEQILNKQKPLGDIDYYKLVENISQQNIIQRLRDEKNLLATKVVQAEAQMMKAVRERDEIKIGKEAIQSAYDERQRELVRENEAMNIKYQEVLKKLGQDASYRQEVEMLRSTLQKREDQWAFQESGLMSKLRTYEKQIFELRMREKEEKRLAECYKQECEKLRQIIMTKGQGPNGDSILAPPPPPIGNLSYEGESTAMWSSDAVPPPPPPPSLINMFQPDYSMNNMYRPLGSNPPTRQTYSPLSHRSADQRSVKSDYVDK